MKTQTFSPSYNAQEYQAVFAQARHQALVLRDDAIGAWIGALPRLTAHSLEVVRTRATQFVRTGRMHQSGKVIE